MRIKRIEPTWDGQFTPLVKEVEETPDTTKTETRKDKIKKAMVGAIVANEILSSDLINHIGQANIEQINYAADLLNQIPQPLKQAAHEPYGARAIIYCLVLNGEMDIQEKQFKYLKEFSDDGIYELTAQVFQEMASLDIQFRLPLIDMALPSLRQLSTSQYDKFKLNLMSLIKADNKVDIF